MFLRELNIKNKNKIQKSLLLSYDLMIRNNQTPRALLLLRHISAATDAGGWPRKKGVTLAPPCERLNEHWGWSHALKKTAAHRTIALPWYYSTEPLLDYYAAGMVQYGCLLLKKRPITAPSFLFLLFTFFFVFLPRFGFLRDYPVHIVYTHIYIYLPSLRVLRIVLRWDIPPSSNAPFLMGHSLTATSMANK